MSKCMYLDGLWIIMHFNSSVDSYREANATGGIGGECCHCHNKVHPTQYPTAGKGAIVICPHCQTPIFYLTIVMTKPIASFLDVRPLTIGGVMSTIVPTSVLALPDLIGRFQAGMASTPSPYDSAFRAINLVTERFVARAESLRNGEDWHAGAWAVINGLHTIYGHVVSPTTGAYPRDSPDSSNRTISEAADRLERYLNSTYGSQMAFEARPAIERTMVPICFDFLVSRSAEPHDSVGEGRGQGSAVRRERPTGYAGGQVAGNDNPARHVTLLNRLKRLTGR